MTGIFSFVFGSLLLLVLFGDSWGLIYHSCWEYIIPLSVYSFVHLLQDGVSLAERTSLSDEEQAWMVVILWEHLMDVWDHNAECLAEPCNRSNETEIIESWEGLMTEY